MQPRPVIAFDTETHKFSPGDMAPPIVCLSWADESGNAGLLVGERIEPWLHKHLDLAIAGELILCGHFVAYDFAVALRTFPSVLDKVFKAYSRDALVCTMVREKLLDIAIGEFRGHRQAAKFVKHGYDLATIARRKLGVSVKKGADTWRLRYADLEDIQVDDWPTEAIDYAVGDAEIDLKVYLSQRERARYSDYNMPTQYADSRASFALHLASVWGIKTDQKQVAELWEHTAAEMSALIPALLEEKIVSKKDTPGSLLGDERTPLPEIRVSTKKVQDLVTKYYPGEPPKTEKTQAVCTDADTVAQCNHPPLQVLGEFQKLRKTANTYVSKLFEPIVHGRFNAVGAGTDRTSANSPNLQNQPSLPGVRECFTAREGMALLACDFDSQEMRTLAQACLDIVGQSRLAERFQEDPHFDPHLEFAAAVFAKISVKEARRRLEAGDPDMIDKRKRAKCFHPDTEVLTRRRGWIRIADLWPGDEVATALPQRKGTTVLGWEVPTKLTSRVVSDGLIHLKTEGIDLRVTDEHRMLGFKQNDEPFVTTPENLGQARCWAGAGVMSGGGFPGGNQDWALLRLAVATQADGSYQRKQIRFGFSKQRKIKRMRSLLRGLPEASWKEGISSQGVTTFVIRKDLAEKIKVLLDNKMLPLWWVNFPLAFRLTILDEVRHWDSTIVRGGKRFIFSSTDRQNIDVLQAIAAISGMKSRETISREAGGNNKTCWSLSVGDHSATRGGALKPKRVPYTGEVVCLSVPASFVLVRDGGITVVTGQCGDFGYPGGMMPPAFVDYARGYGLIITLREATEIRDGFLQQWPEVPLLLEHAKNISGRAGCGIQTNPRSGFRRGNVGYCDAANGCFQTLAAHASKESLWAVCKRCYCDRTSYLYGSRVIVFVHDELILEVPKEAGHEAALELEQVMVAAMEKWTPDVPSAASATLMRSWSKKAVPTFKDGRLVPWEG